MRTVRTFILRLLLDSDDPTALRASPSAACAAQALSLLASSLLVLQSLESTQASWGERNSSLALGYDAV